MARGYGASPSTLNGPNLTAKPRKRCASKRAEGHHLANHPMAAAEGDPAGSLGTSTAVAGTAEGIGAWGPMEEGEVITDPLAGTMVAEGQEGSGVQWAGEGGIGTDRIRGLHRGTGDDPADEGTCCQKRDTAECSLSLRVVALSVTDLVANCPPLSLRKIAVLISSMMQSAKRAQRE